MRSMGPWLPTGGQHHRARLAERQSHSNNTVAPWTESRRVPEPARAVRPRPTASTNHRSITPPQPNKPIASFQAVTAPRQHTIQASTNHRSAAFMRNLRGAHGTSIATLRSSGRDCAQWRSGSAVDDPDASLDLSAPSALRARCGSALPCCHAAAACARAQRSGLAPLCASRGVADMPAWLSLLCGVAVLVAAAYLLYVVLRPEDF